MLFIILDKPQPRQSHKLHPSFIDDPNQLLLPDFQFPQNQSKLNNINGNDVKAEDPYYHPPEEIDLLIPESIPFAYSNNSEKVTILPVDDYLRATT
jgi:hypothetical protein